MCHVLEWNKPISNTTTDSWRQNKKLMKQIRKFLDRTTFKNGLKARQLFHMAEDREATTLMIILIRHMKKKSVLVIKLLIHISKFSWILACTVGHNRLINVWKKPPKIRTFYLEVILFYNKKNITIFF